MTCATLDRTHLAPAPGGPRPARRPLLTADQEGRLARAAAAGDLAARDHLVRSNLGLVYAIARHFVRRGLDLEDLAGEGNLGLLRAAVEFDPGFGVRFSTYAAYWIRAAIQAALAEAAGAIRVPHHMFQQLRAWRRAEAELGADSGTAAGFAAVADRLGLSAERRELVAKALRARRLAPGGEAGGTRRAVDELGEPGEGPAGAAERADEARGLRERMARRLEARERRLLELRYGLDGGGPLTLKQVGERLGMTGEWARKVEARAVAKLRD